MHASRAPVGFRTMVRLLLRRTSKASRRERTEELKDYIAELKEALEEAEEHLKELEK